MKRANDGGPSTLGIYDGAGFRFKSSEGTPPLAAHLTERYGPDWLKIIPVVRQMASETESHLRAAAPASPSRRPRPFSAADLYNLTQVSAYDYFQASACRRSSSSRSSSTARRGTTTTRTGRSTR